MTGLSALKTRILAKLQYSLGASLFFSGVAGWHKSLHTFAMTQLQRASHKQDSKAQALIGTLLTYRGEHVLDKQAGVGLLRTQAIQGNAQSQFLLAESLLKPDMIASDAQKSALTWYEAAAQQGHAMAALRLSKAYEQGLLGLEKNEQQAQYWSQQFMLHSQNMSSPS